MLRKKKKEEEEEGREVLEKCQKIRNIDFIFII